MLAIVLAWVRAQGETIEEVALANNPTVGRADSFPGGGGGQPRFLEQVFAIPNGLDPAIKGHGRIIAGGRVDHHAQRAISEIIFADTINHGHSGGLVKNTVGGKRGDALNAHPHNIGPAIGSNSHSNTLRYASFFNGHNPDLNIGILGHIAGRHFFVYPYPFFLIIGAPKLNQDLPLGSRWIQKCLGFRIWRDTQYLANFNFVRVLDPGIIVVALGRGIGRIYNGRIGQVSAKETIGQLR